MKGLQRFQVTYQNGRAAFKMQRKKVKAKNRVVKYWCASYQAEVLEQKRSFKRASAKSALNLLQASKSTTKAGVLSRQIGRAPDQARLDRVT